MAEYISRKAAFNAILKLVPKVDGDGYCWVIRGDAATAIENIPAADVRPVVRAKWIDRDDDYYGWNMWACSACGEEFVLTEGTPDMNEYHFCPNCGADMREES